MAAEPKLGTKIFYKIGEVSQLTKLPAYVLRFWESEFPFLRPRKSQGQQRLYIRRDIEQVLEIKRMLYDEGFTIAGVRRVWARRTHAARQRQHPRDIRRRMRADLRSILRTLETYER